MIKNLDPGEINNTSAGTSILQQAALMGNLEMVTLLLSNGAFVDFSADEVSLGLFNRVLLIYRC